MSSHAFSNRRLGDECVVEPICDLNEMNLTSIGHDKRRAKRMDAWCRAVAVPEWENPDIRRPPRNGYIWVLREEGNATAPPDRVPTFDGDTLGISKGECEAARECISQGPDFVPHAGRTPRAANTRRPLSIDDLVPLGERIYCDGAIEGKCLVDKAFWGHQSEALGDEESLPTTGSNRALWSCCDAKTAGEVEGCRRPYRRDFSQHLRPSPQSHIRRLAARAGDCASVLAGGLATVVILNSNQTLGTCPALEDDHRWPTVLLLPRYLPLGLRCPSPPLYVAAICAYSAAGVVQIVRDPKYWADCALVAVLASVAAGAVYGVRLMVDALVLGGFLSLLCCRGLVWSTWRGERVDCLR